MKPRCAACGRPSALRKDGTVRAHWTSHPDLESWQRGPRCPGVGELPKEEES